MAQARFLSELAPQCACKNAGLNNDRFWRPDAAGRTAEMLWGADVDIAFDLLKSLSVKLFSLAAIMSCIAALTPLLSHAAPAACPGPNKQWRGDPWSAWTYQATNIVSLSKSGLPRWNGTNVRWETLDQYLSQTSMLPIQVLIIFRPSKHSDCADKIRVRQMMEERLQCQTKTNACDESPGWSGITKSKGPNI